MTKATTTPLFFRLSREYVCALGFRLGGMLTALCLSTTILYGADCSTAPAGLVGWWRGDGSLEDSASTNHGAIMGTVNYGAGRVQQGFVLNGEASGVLLGNPPALHLQSLTIEAWIKRASTAVASYGSGGNGAIVSAGTGGYFFWLEGAGNLHFNAYGDAVPLTGPAVTDLDFHHVAVTKSGDMVTFYLDGQSYGPTPYNGSFGFASPVAIGIHPGGDLSFLGTIDEVGIYNRGLQAAEIQAIYAAGAAGKCLPQIPPVLLQEPVAQAVYTGDNARFSVSATGTLPLGYQWRLEGTNLIGATGSELWIYSADSGDVGNYSVVVSNVAGSVVSSNALLTVLPAPSCITAPTGLVAWWRGQGSTVDEVSGVPASLVGNAHIAQGFSSEGFLFDGEGDGLHLGNPGHLYLQNMTIEAWIKRSSLSSGHRVILSSGNGGYFFWVEANGNLRFNRYGDSGGPSGPAITDFEFHHVTVTKSGSTVIFYLDGQASSPQTLSSVFTLTSSGVAIGFHPDGAGYSFMGNIDELSIYNRALGSNEVYSIFAASTNGKCMGGSYAPVIVRDPTNQSAKAGSDVSLTVAAAGTPLLGYQWRFHGTNLPGATTSVLTLANVQLSQTGPYSAVVSNAWGVATSAEAILSLSFPPASVRLVNTTAMGGGPVIVPVEVMANGNENGLQFSVNFNPTLLTFAGVSLAPGFSDANLLVNTSQVNQGRIGCIMALPTQEAMPAGLQRILTLNFTTAFRSTQTTIQLAFGDTPTVKQLVDSNAAILPATYAIGNVLLLPSVLEADAAPRPAGDRSVTVADWVMLGRFAARLDTPSSASEFQRIDSAPRNTQGDGKITVTDWVQAGRYASGADPLTVVGGPTDETQNQVPVQGPSERKLTMSDVSWFNSQTGAVSVTMTASGEEAAAGFSLSFDPARLQYISAAKGAGSGSAALHINSADAGLGKLGFALGLGSGTFPNGNCELVKVSFRVLPTSAPNVSSIDFVDTPVQREISDVFALPLLSTYTAGTATTRPIPELSIATGLAEVTLSWPEWATNFTLQARSLLATESWTNVPAALDQVNGRYQVVVPAVEPALFYRLATP